MKRQELHKLCCGVIALIVTLTVPEISFAQSGRGGEGFLPARHRDGLLPSRQPTRRADEAPASLTPILLQAFK